MIGKQRIGIDIDGCIAYMLEGIRQEAHHRFGINFKLEDVKEFSLIPQGMTRKQIVDIIEDNSFIIDLPEIYYAFPALQELSSDFEIHLVSARSEKVAWATEQWLALKKFTNIYDALKVGQDCKYDYCKNNNIKIFVEDRYRNALKLAEICDTVYLINKTYNLGRPVPENIIRVEGWHDILGNFKEPTHCPSCGRLYLKTANDENWCIKCDWR